MREVDKIRGMLAQLPISDVKIGVNLLEKRNFTELQHLVNSAIVRVKSSFLKTDPKPEYANVDIDQLEILSMKISLYREQMIEDITNDEDDVLDMGDLGINEEEDDL